jgi:hypothetical protein
MESDARASSESTDSVMHSASATLSMPVQDAQADSEREGKRRKTIHLVIDLC